MGLPLADPQFWLVTVLVAGVAYGVSRRIRRSARDESAPCANCPKVEKPTGPVARGDRHKPSRKPS